MALTDVAIRTAKPSEKPRKITDERGLYLLVQSSGIKLWRFNYRFDGKQKTLTERTIYRLAAAKKIPAFKVGGSWRFSLVDIDRWIKQQSTEGLPEVSDLDVATEKGRRG